MAITPAVIANAGRTTMIDVAKSVDPSGRLAKVAEVLAQASPAFADAPFLPSNSQAGNRVTMRSGLPTVDFVRLNEGVEASKATTIQHVDSMGIILGRSEVDIKAKKIVSDFNGYRYNQDLAFMESMAVKAEATIFAGNEASNSAAFTGFAPRFGDIDTVLGSPYYQVVDGGGAGSDNTSMWIVDWGERACHLIYPEGSPAGLDVVDLGEEVQVLDANSRQFTAAVTEYMLTFGLSIQNFRHVCRIAALDKSDILLASTSSPNIINLLIQGLHKMVAPMGAQRVIYCSRAVATLLEIQARTGSNMALQMMDWAGVPVTSFRGIPIRETDAIGADEADITA